MSNLEPKITKKILKTNTEESQIPLSLENSESPVSKPKIFTEFPTEETFNLRSLNSPHTGSSIKDTFFDKLKDTLLNSKSLETLRHREDSENKSAKPNTQLTIATEAYELTTDHEIPTLVWCAYCKGERKTQVNYVNSSKTFWAAVGIFLAGGVAGCCLAPYYTNRCKSAQMTCSRCGHTVFVEN